MRLAGSGHGFAWGEMARTTLETVELEFVLPGWLAVTSRGSSTSPGYRYRYNTEWLGDGGVRSTLSLAGTTLRMNLWGAHYIALNTGQGIYNFKSRIKTVLGVESKCGVESVTLPTEIWRFRDRERQRKWG